MPCSDFRQPELTRWLVYAEQSKCIVSKFQGYNRWKTDIVTSFSSKNRIRGAFRAAATSKKEYFVIIVIGFQPLSIITNSSILDVAAALDPPLWLQLHCICYCICHQGYRWQISHWCTRWGRYDMKLSGYETFHLSFLHSVFLCDNQWKFQTFSIL